jgi:ribonuclease P protein component
MAGKGCRPEIIAERGAEARALKLETLKNRADFLRTRKGRRHGLLGLALEACRSPEGTISASAARVGFTATRQLGGAVERNRAKRRLRVLAQRVLTLRGRAGHDYVLIARPGTLARRFSELENDLTAAVAAVHRALDRDKNNDAQLSA